METHIPVVFLNLRRMYIFIRQTNISTEYITVPCSFCLLADDLSSQDQFEVPEAGGWDATLSGEDEDDFFDLQIVKHYDGEVGDSFLFLMKS